jgi:hypothetical protein
LRVSVEVVVTKTCHQFGAQIFFRGRLGLPVAVDLNDEWRLRYQARKLQHCVIAQSHREASRRLFEIAEQQQGFFTTKTREFRDAAPPWFLKGDYALGLRYKAARSTVPYQNCLRRVANPTLFSSLK